MPAAMRSYARYWREAFRLPSMDWTTRPRRLTTPSKGRRTSRRGPRGRARCLILALPHSGNWDMAGVWLRAALGRLRHRRRAAEARKSLFERFVAYRESLGFEIFPLSGGETPPFDELAERLRENRVVCLLGERDLGRSGRPGRRSSASRPGCRPVRRSWPSTPVPRCSRSHCWFTGDGWGFQVASADIDVSGGVRGGDQALADRFAADIAAHPADWHMLQPLWLGDLSRSAPRPRWRSE